MKTRKLTIAEFTELTDPRCGIKIISQIARSTKLTDSSKILFGRIMKISKNEYPTREKLAKDLGWSIRKLDHNIKFLKKENLLKTKQKILEHGNISIYTLIFEKILEEV